MTLAPLPSERRGHVRLHYVDEGRGPAVILLHGNPTWSFHFRDLVAGLSGEHRMVAPDHIGCGLSDKPLHYPYTLASHIDNLSRLIDHLQLDEVTLAMHDWGGAIGMGYAVRHPQRIRRLVVFNTAAFLGPIPPSIRVCRWPVLGTVLVRWLNLFVHGAMMVASKRRGALSRRVRAGYRLPYRTRASRVGIQAFVRDIPDRPEHPTWELIQQIDAGLPALADKPMAIYWGRRDFCFHDGFLEGWRQRFPNAEVQAFDDAGHFVVEDAGERIVPHLRRFLQERG